MTAGRMARSPTADNALTPARQTSGQRSAPALRTAIHCRWTAVTDPVWVT